jgi:hypothetical protein
VKVGFFWYLLRWELLLFSLFSFRIGRVADSQIARRSWQHRRRYHFTICPPLPWIFERIQSGIVISPHLTIRFHLRDKRFSHW